MESPNTPAVNGGVPAATPAGGQQAVPASPAPVDNPQVQAQPQAPVAPNPLEAQVAQLQGQLSAMYQLINGLQQPQAQQVPQAPAVPQPTFRERVAALGDPVTAEDPNAWMGNLAEAMEAEIKNRLSAFETTLNPRLQTIQQIEQERAQAMQTAQISRALKAAHPEFANVPDALIGQRLQQLQSDESAFLSIFANDLRSLMQSQNQQPQAQIPQPVQPAPSAASQIPQGSPNANLVQMQADYRSWKANGQLAQSAMANNSEYWSQVHAAAAANKWQ